MQSHSLDDLLQRISLANSWDERIEEIRRVPELFGQAQHAAAYAAIANVLYRPHLSAQFAFVQWPSEYSLESITSAYDETVTATNHFREVDAADLSMTLLEHPKTLRIFRLIIGYTSSEFTVAATEAAKRTGLPQITKSRIDSMEQGIRPNSNTAEACAQAIVLLMTGSMWEVATGEFQSKLEKPDTFNGWESVREFADNGVPYSVLLHQRHYGGPFRTLLDATSSLRGDILEIPLRDLLERESIPYIQTGSQNQTEIAERFGLTVRPAPDFVIYEGQRSLRAIIECKQANDGGTARDKAARFGVLAGEARRLGGVPVFAVLDGLGWQRVSDALGPVIRHTDGRVFTLETLPDMLSVQPFPRLRG